MAAGQTLPSATIRNWRLRWLETKTLEAGPRTHERHERHETSLRRFVEFPGSKADEDLDALKGDDVLRYRSCCLARSSYWARSLEVILPRPD